MRSFDILRATGEPARIKDMGELPNNEQLHGFVFNGEKVGFMHLKIVPLPEVQRYRIPSEANMRIRLMGLDKNCISVLILA